MHTRKRSGMSACNFKEFPWTLQEEAGEGTRLKDLLKVMAEVKTSRV